MIIDKIMNVTLINGTILKVISEIRSCFFENKTKEQRSAISIPTAKGGIPKHPENASDTAFTCIMLPVDREEKMQNIANDDAKNEYIPFEPSPLFM